MNMLKVQYRYKNMILNKTLKEIEFLPRVGSRINFYSMKAEDYNTFNIKDYIVTEVIELRNDPNPPPGFITPDGSIEYFIIYLEDTNEHTKKKV